MPDVRNALGSLDGRGTVVTCARCGASDGDPNIQPTPRIDTVTVRINDTAEHMRVLLCGFCRSAVLAAMRRTIDNRL